ncbi:MAG: hypothetical protein AB8B83_05780 [Bdellovibrionales bacterium]
MQTPYASCQCLNQNYLPESFSDLLINSDYGWSYKHGRFILDFKHCYEVIDLVRDYSRILRPYKIHSIFMTQHDYHDERFFHFSIFEDEVMRAVYDFSAQEEICARIQSAFKSH